MRPEICHWCLQSSERDMLMTSCPWYSGLSQQDVNSVDGNIQFTSEREVGFAILFLDVQIFWCADGSLTTKVYHRHLHFSSHCSTHSLVCEEKTCVKETLERNRYPGSSSFLIAHDLVRPVYVKIFSPMSQFHTFEVLQSLWLGSWCQGLHMACKFPSEYPCLPQGSCTRSQMSIRSLVVIVVLLMLAQLKDLSRPS